MLRPADVHGRHWRAGSRPTVSAAQADCLLADGTAFEIADSPHDPYYLMKFHDACRAAGVSHLLAAPLPGPPATVATIILAAVLPELRLDAVTPNDLAAALQAQPDSFTQPLQDALIANLSAMG